QRVGMVLGAQVRHRRPPNGTNAPLGGRRGGGRSLFLVHTLAVAERLETARLLVVFLQVPRLQRGPLVAELVLVVLIPVQVAGRNSSAHHRPLLRSVVLLGVLMGIVGVGGHPGTAVQAVHPVRSGPVDPNLLVGVAAEEVVVGLAALLVGGLVLESVVGRLGGAGIPDHVARAPVLLGLEGVVDALAPALAG